MGPLIQGGDAMRTSKLLAWLKQAEHRNSGLDGRDRTTEGR
jgi:hypothetical protein